MTDDPRLVHKAREDIRYGLRDLCDPLKRTVWREDGTLTVHHAVSLLKQLREEVANSSNRGGRRKSSTSSPVGVDALDLWNAVVQGAHLMVEQTGASVDQAGPEQAIRRVVAEAGGMTDLEALWGIRNTLDGWVKAIRALLYPSKRIPLWGRPCPADGCGEKTVWRRDESDGEVKQTAALVIGMEEDQFGTLKAKQCECLACGEVWPSGRLLDLAKAMGVVIPGLEEAA